ncbi:MAG: hypothetical protein ACN2B6_12020 [Rickettsiales bacterium]
MADKSKYSHYGWLLGVPVYAAEINSEAPMIEVRHWALEPALDVMQALFSVFCMMVSAMGYEPPLFEIKITGAIRPTDEREKSDAAD